MVNKLGQDETLITGAERGTRFNCITTPSSTPTENGINHEDVIMNYWAMMSFTRPSSNYVGFATTPGVPIKLTMFDTAVSTADMTVTVGGSPEDSKITIAKTGWYMFSASLTTAAQIVTQEVWLHMYWNGNPIYKTRGIHQLGIQMVPMNIFNFIHQVTYPNKDLEIYFEVLSTGGTSRAHEGMVSVQRIQ